MILLLYSGGCFGSLKIFVFDSSFRGIPGRIYSLSSPHFHVFSYMPCVNFDSIVFATPLLAGLSFSSRVSDSASCPYRRTIVYTVRCCRDLNPPLFLSAWSLARFFRCCVRLLCCVMLCCIGCCRRVASFPDRDWTDLPDPDVGDGHAECAEADEG